MKNALKNVEKLISKRFIEGVRRDEQNNNFTFIAVEKILCEFIIFLKEECDFKFLVDLFVVDYPSRTKRFEVNYSFMNLKENIRIYVKVSILETETIDTITDIFSSAGWLEREAWDMYGVVFSGHEDLRRILTDYGFEGHPMRKDFPLTGYNEVMYDQEAQKVVYRPLELVQAYRDFDFVSPWEGPNYQSEEENDRRK